VSVGRIIAASSAIERLREQLIEKHREAAKAAKAAPHGSTPHPVYSNDGT